MHDDRLGRADPSLDLRNGAGGGGPDQPWLPTTATSLTSVCQVLVHVLQQITLEKCGKVTISTTNSKQCDIVK